MGRDPLRRGLCAGGFLLPAFRSFTIDSQSNPLEAGDSSLADPTFLWTTSNPTGIALNSLGINDVTGGVSIASGLADTGSYAATYPAILKTAATYNRFRITGTNVLGSTFSRNYDLYWRWRMYYGESTDTLLDEAKIKALRVSSLNAGFAGVYSFLGGGYKHIAYAAVLGAATTFIDQATGLEVAMSPLYTVSVTNSFGVTTSYNVHRTYNVLGGSLSIVVS